METQEKIKQKKNPRETANILSICFFWYSNIFSEEKNPFAVPKFQVDEPSSWRRLQKRAGAGGFVWAEKERRVRPPGKQVGKVNISDISTFYILLHYYDRHWVTELERAERKPEYKPSLAKAILRSFGPFYLSLGIFTFIEECFIRIFQPLFMGEISEAPPDGQTITL